MGLLANRSIVTAGLPYSESLATKALTSDFYHVAIQTECPCEERIEARKWRAYYMTLSSS